MTIIEIEARGDGGHGLQSQSGRQECWLEGWIAVPSELERQVCACLGYCELDIQEGALAGITPTAPPRVPVSIIPTAEHSSVVMMRSAFAAQLPAMDDGMVIQCSGLADDWAPGAYAVGDVRNTRDGVHGDGAEWEQTWEVHQAHDTAANPDIKPGEKAWHTFWRPLHGQTPETARPWVQPQYGTTDIYHAGEYMIWEDGMVWHCLRDTNFSPEEQPDAWEVYPGQ